MSSKYWGIIACTLANVTRIHFYKNPIMLTEKRFKYLLQAECLGLWE